MEEETSHPGNRLKTKMVRENKRKKKGALPDDVVEEIVRVRQAHRKEFGKYHAMFKLLPMTAFPLGTPKKFAHPGVFKAMKKPGYPIPKTD